MADESEAVVEVGGVLAVQSLHAAGEIRLRRPHEQVKVVCHEAEGVQSPAVTADHSVADSQEPPAIVVVLEDRLTPVASTGDVIGAACDLDSWRPRHDLSVRPTRCSKQGYGRFVRKLSRSADMSGV